MNGLKLWINQKHDIIAYVESITWSGDMDKCARTLSFKLAPGAEPEVGDKVNFFLQKESIFYGIVTYVDIDMWGVSVEANDYGVYLANNYTYKEYKGTPQSITKKICSEFGIEIKKLEERKETEKVTSTGNMSAFKVIEQAYEGENEEKNRQYAVRMQGKKLVVEKINSEVAAALEYDIESASRSSSIKEMVNKVIILDKEGKKKTGEAENAKDRKKYGTFQKNYKKEKDKNAKTEAKRLLKTVKLEGSVSALGNIKCIAGKAVEVYEKRSGLKGRYVIKSDRHTFDHMGYTGMELSFYHEN